MKNRISVSGRAHVIAVLVLVVVIVAALSTGCVTESQNDKIKVAVTILPEKTFIEMVCGSLADITVMIPPGYSPENYEPSPKLMEGLDKAQVYFTIGVQSEEAFILPRIRENEKLSIVRLEDAAALKYKEVEISPGERDPHIWLSPKRVAVMVSAAGEAMCAADPLNSSIYRENTAAYIRKLDELDARLEDIFKGAASLSFMVFHPAFGYLAEDYGLIMYSLEKEGKEATAKHLKEMTDLALLKGIKTVFYQAETDSRQSEAFAEGVGGKAVLLDPLSPDYINNIIFMAETIAGNIKAETE